MKANQHTVEQIIKILQQAENGKEERFNGTVRDECLNMLVFASVVEAQLHLDRRHRR